MNALKSHPNQELKFSFQLSCLAMAQVNIASTASLDFHSLAIAGNSYSTVAFMAITILGGLGKRAKLLDYYFHRSCLLVLLGTESLLVGRSDVASCCHRHGGGCDY